MNLETQIIVFAGLQGIALSIILFKHALKKNKSNKYLAALVLIFSINILIDEACRNLSHQYPHFYGTSYGLQFLFGPILYIYVSALLGWIGKMEKRDWLHFAPFAAVIIILIPFYVQPGSEKIRFILQLIDGPIITLLLIKSVPAFHFFGYALYILIKGQFKKQPPRLKPASNSPLKKRIMIAVGINGFIWFSVGILYLFRAFNPEFPIKGVIYNITGATTTMFIYIIGYLGWLYPETYQHISVVSKHEDKYNRSGLGKDDSIQLFKKLVEIMNVRRTYLESELTMSDLAEEMSVSSNHLSQVINENCGVSYFDFINKFRVIEAKKMLEDPTNKKNTLQIAYAVGFNSKSAFYNAFKKNFNCTPSTLKRANLSLENRKLLAQA